MIRRPDSDFASAEFAKSRSGARFPARPNGRGGCASNLLGPLVRARSGSAVLWPRLGIMSFLLLDRITEFAPGRAARGRWHLPPAPGGVPPCLLVESVGQLAAYVAMEWSGFASRSVAATAGEVHVLADATGNCDVDLEIEITSARSVAVAYRGRASQRGATILTLERAVGGLLPMAEFDDPARVAGELEALRGAGVPARLVEMPASLRTLASTLERSADRLRAEIAAPASGSFYADHFPRRPVYPATLLLDAQIALAADLLASGAARPRLERVRNVKVRAFTPPGGRLEVEIERLPDAAGRATVALRASSGAEKVSSATAEFILEGGPA
jgi:3-hydroxymyristoyl/3-hydroxydecanoyl-(acyl carrier protein) dehydratase